MINFCHIAPTAYLDLYTKSNGAHLILAHLVETDPVYRDFYANLDDGRTKIMDNGAFEMFKAGLPMYPTEKLIEMAKACKAEYVVMSDYPKQPCKKTARAAYDQMQPLVDAGFTPFYCPQSELGDMTGVLDEIEWAIDEPRIGLIGISILNAPIACGVEERKHGKFVDQSSFEVVERVLAKPVKDDWFLMQRYLSRWKLFREMEKRGILSKISMDSLKRYGGTARFHMLGMVDGPNEIDLMREYHKYIYSWDSSAAVWAGLNGIEFDQSPTGLIKGKFELEVDFKHTGAVDSLLVRRNISYINRLCKGK